MTAALRRPFAGLLLAIHLAGCTYWQPATVAPRELIEIDQPSLIRITPASGESLVIQSPSIRGDSIAGVRPRSRETRGILLSDVRSIEVSHVSAGRTLGLVVLTGVVALAGFYTYLLIALGDSS